MTLYEEYVSGWKEFEARLYTFNENTRKKVVNRLRKETDRMNFLSLITEVNFSLLCTQNAVSIEYEKNIKQGIKNRRQTGRLI
ncbi:hypothetical protein OKW21_006140 [Catalinimonas alkaloidigena]|nr:hypothetical protein [Catalinimonas alkaloidigena]